MTKDMKKVFITDDYLNKAEKFAKTPVDETKFDKLCGDIDNLWGDENINSSLTQEDIDANCF